MDWWYIWPHRASCLRRSQEKQECQMALEPHNVLWLGPRSEEGSDVWCFMFFRLFVRMCVYERKPSRMELNTETKNNSQKKTNITPWTEACHRCGNGSQHGDCWCLVSLGDCSSAESSLWYQLSCLRRFQRLLLKCIHNHLDSSTMARQVWCSPTSGTEKKANQNFTVVWKNNTFA